jgi:hypothetical protein
LQQFPAASLIHQLSHYIPQVPHLYPDTPIPGTFSPQFFGQLGQNFQQGIVNHYTGNFPFGPQIPSQFPGGQVFPPPVRPVGSALASIAMYDDLKCVPRLLCEIAAGGKPGQSVGKLQDSLLPFLNRDTLLS